MEETIEEFASNVCEQFNKNEHDNYYWLSMDSARTIVKGLIAKGYRKESDTAREICDLILEYWKVDAFVDCNWVIEVISEKYGLELVE